MKFKLQFIQAMRGLAALMVVLVHVHIVLTAPNKSEVLNNIRGYLGVPLFFILSGFIMVFTTSNRSNDIKSNIKQFLLKRILRIVPLFYLSILLYFAINQINPLSFTKHNLEYMVRLLFFLPLFSDKTGPFYGISFLYVNWSLNYEMMFYGAFALSFLFRKRSYYFLYSLFLAMIFIIPVLLVEKFKYDYTVYYSFKFGFLNFFTNPISLLFIIGVSFGLLIKKVKFSPLYMRIFIGLSIALFIMYFFSFINYSQIRDTIFCSLLIFSILLIDFNIPGVRVPRALTYLGDISYSIYLMHPLVLIFLSKLVQFFKIESITNSWYFLLCIYGAVIIFSAFTYELVEKRFTLFLKNKILNQKKIVVGLRTMQTANSVEQLNEKPING